MTSCVRRMRSFALDKTDPDDRTHHSQRAQRICAATKLPAGCLTICPSASRTPLISCFSMMQTPFSCPTAAGPTHDHAPSTTSSWSHLMATKGDLDDSLSILGESGNSNSSSNGPLRTRSSMSLYRNSTASLYSKRSRNKKAQPTEKQDEELPLLEERPAATQHNPSPPSYTYKTSRLAQTTALLSVMGMASFLMSNLLIDVLGLRPIQQQVQTMSTSMQQPPTERFQQLLSVVLPTSGKGGIVESTDVGASPQYRALEWLANRDGMQLNATSPNLLQRYALATLFYSTTSNTVISRTSSSTGGTWKRRMHWLSGMHECDWQQEGGVRACNGQQQVTDLSLWNNLDGTIPAELGYGLPKLQVLYLAHNKLRGTLPTELGLLTDLTYLGVQHNLLTGRVPSEHFGGLTKLRTMYLEKNDLSGVIRRVEPLCQLKHDAVPGELGGVLKHITADCKSFVSWKPPEVTCGCCTKCYAA